MELERRGYEYVWCIDAESFPLTNFSVNDIFSYSQTNNLLSVFEQGGWNNSDIVNHVLKIEDDTLSQMLKVGVRINDFWIINLQFFRNMMQELTNKHRKALSYFVLGTEQGLYELWLYHKHLTKSLDIEVILLLQMKTLMVYVKFKNMVLKYGVVFTGCLMMYIIILM